MTYRIKIFLVVCAFFSFFNATAGIIEGYNYYLDHLTKHKALPAKIVYHNDTIEGMAIFEYNANTERLKGQWQEQCYRMFVYLDNDKQHLKFNIADTALTYISLSDSSNGKKLQLVKFPHVNTFLRVLHQGKLCVYDRIYSFSYRHSLLIHGWSYHTTLLSRKADPFADSVGNLTVGRFEKIKLWDQTVNVASCLSWRNLITAINDVYHLHINPDDYPRKGREKKLYALMATLD